MNFCAVDTTINGGYALPMDKRQETILLEQARDGCEQSFETLVRQNSGKMIQLAFRLVNNRSDAEEIVQEAFLRLYRSLGSFRGESRIGTWLYRTVSNLAIDHLRREKIKRKLFFLKRNSDDADPVEFTPSSEPAQDDQLMAREELATVVQSLDKLSPRQRTVLTLRHQENLSIREIADILGLSEGSIKVHLHRAIQTLRAALDDMGDKP
ncbi:MAG: RNA polymerase sigma factor [Desulfuromonas sp.]|nr:MAG: RNA polymerase sigma factor [Desulfuromonas sp.]